MYRRESVLTASVSVSITPSGATVTDPAQDEFSNLSNLNVDLPVDLPVDLSVIVQNTTSFEANDILNNKSKACAITLGCLKSIYS
jgi:hypothetical protein